MFELELQIDDKQESTTNLRKKWVMCHFGEDEVKIIYIVKDSEESKKEMW